MKFREGPRGDISFEEFLSRVEAIAHPGKSSMFKKHRMSSLPLDTDTKRPSIATGPSPPVFLWQRWQVVVVLIALAILVLPPILLLAGYTINFALHDRSCHFSPARPIWLERKE